ncbi:MAG: ribose-5-phosphate isomerase RpiA, partial [Myxococcales bacterium]|nr:ribose-5-phosphate isomerase RpiA [Myxococcales bacterium]
MPELTPKERAARAALDHVIPGTYLGVGTGSTVDLFIDALASSGLAIKGAVSSSLRSQARLEAAGIPVVELSEVDRIPLYVDGADEVDPHLFLTKGGGGALTREKIVAAASARFVCIADESKLVERLGTFPIPIEIIPMALPYVQKEIRLLGGDPVWREHFVTDNGNWIVDVGGWDIVDPVALESELNHIVGT